MSSRWFLLLITLVLPIFLIALAVVFRSNICIILALLTWIGLALMIFYLPRFHD